MQAPCGSRESAVAIAKIFAELEPVVMDRPLKDFSGLRSGSAYFCEVAPRSLEAVIKLVRLALKHGIALRSRAQGHSLNGATLPNSAELLVSMGNLRHVRFEQPGTVTAGAGVVLWILQHLLRKQRFDLPVLNDGYAGPSVGGYLAAGGFGPRSEIYGGFWDNVVEITLVDGYGNLRRVSSDDALFPWLFGSMGQLGMFCEIKLIIVPRDDTVDPQYPLGRALVTPPLVGPPVTMAVGSGGDDRLFWFTLLVPDEYFDEALAELDALERRNGRALHYSERYRYRICYRGKTAPLVYPEARAFTATGAWGWLSDDSPAGVERLLVLDEEFMELVSRTSNCRRYIQSELVGGPEVFQQYFDSALYSTFRGLKEQIDPGFLFNRRSVFHTPG